jgi:hypothetical protein
MHVCQEDITMLKSVRNIFGLLGVSLVVSATAIAADSYLLWTEVNQSLVITSTPPVMTSPVYAYTVEVTDPDGDVLNYSLTNAPEGMTINTATGLITWTATLVQVGA